MALVLSAARDLTTGLALIVRLAASKALAGSAGSAFGVSSETTLCLVSKFLNATPASASSFVAVVDLAAEQRQRLEDLEARVQHLEKEKAPLWWRRFLER